MGQTISEKILAAHAGKRQIEVGDLVEISLDIILAHEVTTPPAISMLEKMGMDVVFNPDRIIVTPDHFVPNKDEKSAELAKRLRGWVKRHNIKNYYEIGRHGICHTILLEQGHIGPGMTVVAGDSHTCTHGVVGAFGMGVGSTELAAAIARGKTWLIVPDTIRVNVEGAMGKGVYSKDVMLHILSDIGVDGATDCVIEYGGSTIDEMEVEDRVVLSNMAVEAGATLGIINPDEKTVKYVKSRGCKGFMVYTSDKEAAYKKTLTYDISDVEPTVAEPPLPSNGRPVSEFSDMQVNQAYLGSCTNGRIQDLREAAKVLKGKRVNPDVRMIVVPATTDVYRQALKEGLLEVFIKAGAAVSTPTCGACLGGHMGVLAEGEVAIASTNRNFVGRMGHPKSKVYLASPATVAASAIMGRITDPRRYLK